MSDNPQSLHGGNEGGDGRGRYNREMPRRPRYDYLRLSLSNTRWERVNRLNTRIGTAEAWLDEQLRAHASLAHYSDRLDALTQTANIARPQSVQGNDRFINRSRDHDIRESGTRILQRTANQFEDLALEVLNERGQEHDQFTHTRISEHVKDARRIFNGLEANNFRYHPTPDSGHLLRDDFIEAYQRAYDKFCMAIIPAVRANAQGRDFNTLMHSLDKFTQYQHLFEQCTGQTMPPPPQELPRYRPEADTRLGEQSLVVASPIYSRNNDSTEL